MSLLRACPGELAVRGNYLCPTALNNAVISFFFGLFFVLTENTVSADFGVGTAVLRQWKKKSGNLHRVLT